MKFKVSRDGGNTKLPWVVYEFVTRQQTGLRYWRGVGNFKTKTEADEYAKAREAAPPPTSDTKGREETRSDDHDETKSGGTAP